MSAHVKTYGISWGYLPEGVLGYEMGARTQNMENVGKVFCEPIWVWSKGEAPEPKWNSDTFLGFNMWGYYGSKAKIVGQYPKPTKDKIIEPFAGLLNMP